MERHKGHPSSALSGRKTGGLKIQKEEKVPWTASRCLRISRPVLSKLNALRKLKGHRLGSALRDNTLTWNPEQVSQQRSKKRCSHNGTIVTSTPQPKADSKLNSNWTDGVTVPTPILKDALGYDDSESADCTAPGNGPMTENGEDFLKPSNKQALSRKRSIRVQGTDGPDPKSFLDSFDIFIKATALANHTSPNTFGVPSLQSICLKNIGRSLSNITSSSKDRLFQEEFADDEVDVIYSMIEALLPCHNNGSKPLRLVVREYVVSMICNALQDSVFDSSTVSRLTELIDSNQASDIYKSILLVHGLPLDTFRYLISNLSSKRLGEKLQNQRLEFVITPNALYDHALYTQIPRFIHSKDFFVGEFDRRLFFDTCSTAVIAVVTKDSQWRMAARYLQEIIRAPTTFELITSTITSILSHLVSIELLQLASKIPRTEAQDGKSMGIVVIQELINEFAQQIYDKQIDSPCYVQMSTLTLSGVLISLFEEPNACDRSSLCQAKSIKLFNRCVAASNLEYNSKKSDDPPDLQELMTMVRSVAKYCDKAFGLLSGTMTTPRASTIFESIGNTSNDTSLGCIQIILDKMLRAPGSNPYLLQLALASGADIKPTNQSARQWLEDFETEAVLQISSSNGDFHTNIADDHLSKHVEHSTNSVPNSSAGDDEISCHDFSRTVGRRYGNRDYRESYVSGRLLEFDETLSSVVASPPSLCHNNTTLMDTLLTEPSSSASSEDSGSDFTPMKTRYEILAAYRKSPARLSTLLRPDPGTPNGITPGSPLDVLMSLGRTRSPPPLRKPRRPYPMDSNTPRRDSDGSEHPRRRQLIFEAPRTAVPSFLPASSSPVAPVGSLGSLGTSQPVASSPVAPVGSLGSLGTSQPASSSPVAPVASSGSLGTSQTHQENNPVHESNFWALGLNESEDESEDELS